MAGARALRASRAGSVHHGCQFAGPVRAGRRSPIGRGSDPQDWRERRPMEESEGRRRDWGTGDKERTSLGVQHQRSARGHRSELGGRFSRDREVAATTPAHRGLQAFLAITTVAGMACGLLGRARAGKDKGGDERAAQRQDRQPFRPSEHAPHPGPSDHGARDVSMPEESSLTQAAGDESDPPREGNKAQRTVTSRRTCKEVKDQARTAPPNTSDH